MKQNKIRGQKQSTPNIVSYKQTKKIAVMRLMKMSQFNK